MIILKPPGGASRPSAIQAEIGRYWSVAATACSPASSTSGCEGSTHSVQPRTRRRAAPQGESPVWLQMWSECGHTNRHGRTSVDESGRRSSRFCCCSEGGTRTRDTTKATDAPGVFPRNPKTSNDHGLARDSLRERMLPKRLYSGRLGTPRVSSSAYSLNKRARIKSRRAHRRPLSNTAVLRNSCGPDTYVFGHPSGLHP